MTMASYRDQAFFLSLALFLAILTTTPYVAHGYVTVTVTGMRASGLVFCTGTGIPLAVGFSLPLVGANVTLSCANIGSASVLTNGHGFFSITKIPPVNVSLGLNLTVTPLLSNCDVIVKPPVRGCTALPIKGLRGFLYPIGLLVDQQGVILNLGVLGYTPVVR